jgi:hypothetical protein
LKIRGRFCRAGSPTKVRRAAVIYSCLIENNAITIE